MTNEMSEHPALSRTMQGGEMLQADEVVAMLRLHALGWGATRLSKEFGCARNTVRRYLREGGAVPFKKPVRGSAFDGLDDWLRERFFRHDGNADVIRQELVSEHGVITGRSGLVTEMHAIKLCDYPLDYAAHTGIRCLNLAEIADLSVPARFDNSNRILRLGDIDSDKSFSIICHGSSSCDEDRLGPSEQLGRPV